MTKLMYVKASPRGERSHSIAVANAFVQAYLEKHPDTEVLERNIFEMDLPPFDGQTIRGKYNIMQGRDFTPEEENAWKAVEAVIQDFSQADVYAFAVPMWNFNIPYRLKHLIDLIVQPGYTFSVDDQGYHGLLKNKKAFVAYARSGSYPKGDPREAYNHQSPYLRFILGFMGITDVHTVALEGTLSPGLEDAKKAAVAEARNLAATKF